MKKKLTLCLLCCIGFAASITSCKQQPLDVLETPLSVSDDEMAYKIPLDSLKKQALAIGGLFYDSRTQTKSLSLAVKSVSNINIIMLTKGLTKSTNSNSENPQAYVINFEDDKGFAILADDRRLSTNILAYSDNGNIDANTENPGVISFLEEVNTLFSVYPPQDYIIEEAPTEIPFSLYRTDRTVTPSNWGVTRGERFVWRCPELIETIAKGKMLNTNWHQAWPYNAALGDDMISFDAHASTIALAQLMSYYSKPSQISIGNTLYPIDWNKAINGDILGSNIQYLIKSIDASITDENLPQKLSAHGYLSNGNSAFNESTILNELKNNRPVIVSAIHTPDENHVIPWNANHHWVIDGYIITSRSTRITDYLSNQGGRAVIVGQRIDDNLDDWQPYNTYYHFNWGWGGKSNGYFSDLTSYWQNYKFDYNNNNNNQSVIKYANNRKTITQIRPQ